MSRPDSICRHFESFVTEELLERRVDVDGVAFEERDAIAGVEDRRVEAEAAAIEKVSPVDRANVDSARSHTRNELSDLLRAATLNADCFREVITSSGRHNCQSARRI